jgi:hypothetical protein
MRRPRVDLPAVLVTAATFTYAMWIASPAFLPVTNGPDVVHHLQLIHAIARLGRVPHDPALSPYLLEMMDYTPGSHLLAAAVAAWLRLDPLRVIYPLAALFVAVKAGLLYGLARRLAAGTPYASLAAIAAPVLVFVPAAYFLGSLLQFFFYAQLISEAFAMGFLVALVSWTTRRETSDALAVSACAVGIVLAWPVWLAPCAMTAASAVWAAPVTWRRRIGLAAWMLGPAIGLAGAHQLAHRGAVSIVASSGAVTAPSMAVFGVGFVILTAAGVFYAVRESTGRVVVVFLASTLVTAARWRR